MPRQSLRKIALTACTLVLFASAAFARKVETGFLNRLVSVGGESYRYAVYVPADWATKKKWPVILFLHGSGERGDDGLMETDVGLPHAIRMNVANFPFVVVIPQCRQMKVWTDPDMEAQTFAALDQAEKEFHGDRDRVYLTGLSMGGYGTWAFGVKYAGKFKALVPVCGGIQAPSDWPQLHVAMADNPKVADPYAEAARLIGKTPVWIFHGDADPAVPVEGARKMYAALQTSGGKVKYTEYPGVGHNSWDRAYAEPGLIPWLMEQGSKP